MNLKKNKFEDMREFIHTLYNPKNIECALKKNSWNKNEN